VQRLPADLVIQLMSERQNENHVTLHYKQANGIGGRLDRVLSIGH